MQSGATLTINAGTIVNFTALSDDQGSGTATSRSELIINGGTLIINGSSASPVTFTSSATGKVAGDWQGIRVINGGSITVRYAVIEYAVNGIDYRLTGVLAGSPVIEDSTIQNVSSNGIYLDTRAGAQVTASILRNTINNVGSRGLYTNTRDTNSYLQATTDNNSISNCGLNCLYGYAYYGRQDYTIENSTILTSGTNTNSTNDRAGIRLYNQYQQASSSQTLRNNDISGATGRGVQLEVYRSYNTPVISLIEGNTIHNNSSDGVYIYGYYNTYNTTMVNNVVENNTGHGLYFYHLYGSYGGMESTFMLNTLRNNGGRGIYIQGSDRAQHIIHNSITGNGSEGIYINTNRVSNINYNNLSGNAGSNQLYNNNAAAVDASYNWWGTSMTTAMALGNNPKNIVGLYDVYDNNSKGSINYSNWLSASQTEPFNTAPQSWINNPANNRTMKASTYSISGSASALDPIDRVEVSTDGGVSWNIASGKASWSYNWAIPAGDGVYQIRSRVITSTAIIETPSAGNSVTVDSTLKTTSGIIASDETWSGVINITGDITVNVGANLTIEPGTVINLTRLSDDRNTGDNSRIDFIVNGSIIANGTSTLPVLFTSSASTKAKSDWVGIRVNGTASFSYTTVEYAKYGIACYASSINYGNCTIDNAIIRDVTGDGLYSYANTAKTPVFTVSNSEIYNTSRGIYVLAQQSSTNITVNISGNNIYSTSAEGIYTYSYLSGAKINGSITNNILNANQVNGIRAEAYSTGIQTLDITNNKVSSIVGGNGIWVYNNYNASSSSTVNISSNEVFNCGTGIRVFNSRNTAVTSISNNDIHNNVTYGMHFDYSSNFVAMVPILSNNKIYNQVTGTGIYANLTNPISLPGHVFYGNGLDIRNQSAQSIDATGLWWGVDTTNAINSGANPRNLNNLYDSFNDVSKGTIDYSGWINLYVPPANPTVSTIVSPTINAIQVISGIKDANSGVSVNGIQVVAIDALTTWSATVNLQEGGNYFSIYSFNAVGLNSGSISATVIRDSLAPTVFDTTPNSAVILNTQFNTIEFVLTETGTAIDSAATLSGATVFIGGSTPVAGVWSNSGNRFVFTASSNFIAGNYTATINPTDTPLANTSVAIINFTVDNAAPAAVILNPVTSPANVSPQVLSGTKEANTAVYANGILVIPLDANTTWTYSQVLTAGTNAISLVARDAAGNDSPPVSASILYDSVPPSIVFITPNNGSYSNTVFTGYTVTFSETLSGINSAATLASVSIARSGGAAVSGSWNLLGNNVIFTPSSGFSQDTYAASVNVIDLAGNNTLVNSSFTYDATPPALPTINPVTSPTNSSFQVLSGAKEANSSIWVNGLEVVAINASTTWSYSATLVTGSNNFSIQSRDQADNQSGSVNVAIQFDDVAPIPVSLTVDATGVGTTAALDWTGYNETQVGDIQQYQIYSSTNLFTNVSTLTPVATVAAGTFTYNFASLVKGQQYFFAVVAIDVNGNINQSVTPVSATPADTIAPEEITNFVVTSSGNSLTSTWDASANTAADLANYKFYFNGDVGTLLDTATLTRVVSGLTASTSYPIRITAIDADGNESAGVSVSAVTLLANPTGLSSTALNNQVVLSWNATVPSNLVKNYAIYSSTTNFTDVSAMTPSLLVSNSITSRGLAGLTNNTAYYFAVTAINLSGGETKAVTTITETPTPDGVGPALSAATYNSIALVDNATLTTTALLSVSATDQSGMSRVEFAIDGSVFTTDTNGSNGYSAMLDLSALTDGAHTITITGYDTLGNTTVLTIPVTIALAAPASPTISAPANNLITNKNTITVTGSAAKQTTVNVLVNSVLATGSVAVNSSGGFSTTVTLTSGANSITATANNRGGSSVASAAVNVTLDTSIPDAPVGLAAKAKELGQVRLTWNATADTSIKGYNVYRSLSAFTATSSATKANASLITGSFYDDLVTTDGTYYYSVVAVNSAGTEGSLSNQATTIIDNVPPKADSIIYSPVGNQIGNRIAPGRVDVTVTVSEALLTTPFLSISPNNGIPISISLAQGTSETEYIGSFVVTDSTPTGIAYAVFSARDKVGNRGTEIGVGATVTFDTDGPVVTANILTPADPIRNDQASPVTVNFTFTLDEPVASGQAPAMSYSLSAAGRTAMVINNLIQLSGTQWRGSFVLPADAGLAEVETLSFIYSGTDDLGNVSTKITAANQIQVYQGNLPPLGIPANFRGTTLAGGNIKLDWDVVTNAVAYQLYRQAPLETTPIAYQRINSGTTFTDIGLTDGDYIYSVSSIRAENAQESLSVQSTPITVASDSSAPANPANLSLVLLGSGIQASWNSVGTDTVTYNLYRAAVEIFDVTSLTPIRTAVTDLTTLDYNPSESDHYYAVTAVDAAGNESTVSNSPYLNFDLLPVTTFAVEQIDDQPPVLNWTHTGTTITGYDLYLGADSATGLKLNTTGTMTVKSYTDTGYSNNERMYAIVALDASNTESVARSLLLPKISATLDVASTLKRGVMNQLNFTVKNDSTTNLSGVQLKVAITTAAANTYNHVSAKFDIAAGASKVIPVIVGGYTDLDDITTLQNTIEISPNSSESVRVTRNQQINVGIDKLLLNIITDQVTRGANSDVQFTLQNTSGVEIEIITARASGTKSSDQVRLKLLDIDNNVLSSQAILQDTGSNTIRLSNGTTVIRIPAGQSVTTSALTLPIPSSAPDQVWVRLEIDKTHYRFGKPEAVNISGLTTNRELSLVETLYSGTVTSVSPTLSYGGKDFVITGQAIERATSNPIAAVGLRLVVTKNGFERKYDVITDDTGSYSYTFKPLQGESGNYNVSAIHPDLLDRPVNATFVIRKVNLNFTRYTLNTARDFDQNIPFKASALEGTTATNLRFVYEAVDQTSGTFIPGLVVTPTAPQTLLPGNKRNIDVTMRADINAPDNGTFYLKLLSDESGSIPLAIVPVTFTLSDASPALYFTPNFVDSGVAQDSSINETIILDNRGLAPLTGINIELLNANNTLAPSWLYLTVAKAQADLAVGEKRAINFVAAPPTSVSDGNYNFKLRVTSSNAPVTDINVYMAITQSGVGNVLFKLSDIYTATKDAQGNIIQGLQGAKIRVQNEKVLTVDKFLNTDIAGEVLFNALPTGWYKFRATAANHQEVIGRFRIKSGVTLPQDVFLNYNLITVEWQVNEITISDKYEIVLSATYEVDVPAAVVLVEPTNISLPTTMQPGDVFYGELTITNYGLIRADNFEMNLPTTDAYFKYEFMSGIPAAISAKERLTIPYRVTALQPADASSSGTATGGGNCGYSAGGNYGYDYVCANGTIADGGGGIAFSQPSSGSCGGGGGGGGSGGGGGGWGGWGGSGGGGGGGRSYSPTSLGGAQCVPECKDGDCNAGGQNGGDS